MDQKVYRRVKKRIFEVIEKGEKSDKYSMIFDYFIMLIIILNVFLIVIESFEGLGKTHEQLFKRFEIISVIIFSIEYILRLWTADYKIRGHKNHYKARLRFIFTPMAIIDLLAILPFYLPFFFIVDFRVLRVLRLIRIMRALKLNRYSNSVELIGRVLRKEKESLFVVISIIFMLILVSATLMYYFENEAQPEAFPDIVSSFWWAIVTLTTVGYGDIYPITIAGKSFGGFIALLGIGIVALPTGIISSGFMEQIQERRRKESEKECKICPMCAENIKKHAKVCKHCHYDFENGKFIV